MTFAALDIGGTKIAHALVNKDGSFAVSPAAVKTPDSLAKLTELFLNIRKNYGKIDGVAIATAGVVCNNRLTFKPNNLPSGYENIDFTELFGVPVLLENDANAAIWAEYRQGALQGKKNCVLLTLGTDVGCGIVCNGALLKGKCGAAGEVRFAASGRGLAQIAAAAGLDETDCFVLAKMAKDGNAQAQKVLAEWQKNLLDAVCLLNDILDTEAVALSGSLSEIAGYTELNERICRMRPHNPPLIVRAKFGTEAGIAGAALLGSEKFYG